MIKAESNVFYSSTEIKTTERNNVECSLNLTEENADKILDLTGKVYQSAADKEGDLVVFGGLATFNAVFVGDELMRIEVGAKFSFKTAMPGADADVSDVKHALEGVRVKTESGMLYVVATLVTEITYTVTEEKSYIDGADVLVKTASMKVGTNHRFVSETELTDEFEEKKIKRVLYSGAEAALKSVTAEEDAVICEGEAIISVLMLPFSENSDILKEVRCIPFRFEVDCDGANSAAFSYGDVEVDKLNLKVYVDEAKNRSTVSISAILKLCGAAVTISDAAYVEDCYSVNCDLIPTRTTLESTSVSQRFSTDRVSGVVNCKVPEYSRFIKLMGECVELADLKTDGDKLTVIGVVTGKAIFADGENALSSRTFDLPFDITLPCGEGTAENVKVTAKEVYCKLRAGRLEAETELITTWHEVQKSRYNVINTLTEGNKRQAETAAFSVYLAMEGDTEWDVTKRLGVSFEEISKYNPDLKFPLTGKEKITVFRKPAETV